MSKTNNYRRLSAALIVASLTQLEARIRDRFPAAGLALVCQDLMMIAGENTSRAAAIEKRHWWLRFGVAAVIALGCAGLVKLLRLVDFSKTDPDNVYVLVQGVDAMIHLVFVMGGLIFFLITAEDRWKRRRALKALNELRSIIHVIDMHQLTKEPASILAGGAPTPHSPTRSLSAFELGRYLDYCSEMLSLVAKVAVLYAQSQPDPVIVDAVSDIERLTTNLSQKIWQKIMLVHTGASGYELRIAPTGERDVT
jgi:hypothetical protein